MSKNIKPGVKDLKEGTMFSVKEAESNMSAYFNKKKENLEFILKYFLISISILLSTNIYIHKTVSP
jgi:hypothetical protein